MQFQDVVPLDPTKPCHYGSALYLANPQPGYALLDSTNAECRNAMPWHLNGQLLAT